MTPLVASADNDLPDDERRGNDSEASQKTFYVRIEIFAIPKRHTDDIAAEQTTDQKTRTNTGEEQVAHVDNLLTADDDGVDNHRNRRWNNDTK